MEQHKSDDKTMAHCHSEGRSDVSDERMQDAQQQEQQQAAIEAQLAAMKQMLSRLMGVQAKAEEKLANLQTAATAATQADRPEADTTTATAATTADTMTTATTTTPTAAADECSATSTRSATPEVGDRDEDAHVKRAEADEAEEAGEGGMVVREAEAESNDTVLAEEEEQRETGAHVQSGEEADLTQGEAQENEKSTEERNEKQEKDDEEEKLGVCPVFTNALVCLNRAWTPRQDRVVDFAVNFLGKDSVTLLIAVRNVAPKKHVFVRYTDDAWATYSDAKATQVGIRKSTTSDAAELQYMTFSADVVFAPHVHEVELCICYRAGEQTHWNNNDEMNYKLSIIGVDASAQSMLLESVNGHKGECEHCTTVVSKNGECPVCLTPDTLLYPSVHSWASEHWVTQGCGHSACRECLANWYRVQVLDGARVIRCIAPDCDLQVKPPDVHVVDVLLGALFVMNQRTSHEGHFKDMMQDSELACWLNDNARKCPSCAVAVERETGCNEMLCHCGARFCYECGESLEGGTCLCSEY